MQRREFLITVCQMAAAIPLPWGLGVTASATVVGMGAEIPLPVSESDERLLAIVLDHLLPTSVDAPGARDINAKSYLLRVLAHPSTPEDEQLFLRNGLRWLNELAIDERALPFEALTTIQQESVLHSLAAYERGESWLSTLLGYTFEACFGDPVYGGNPDGIGWRWIDHHPGFPRPLADNIYGSP